LNKTNFKIYVKSITLILWFFRLIINSKHVQEYQNFPFPLSKSKKRAKLSTAQDYKTQLLAQKSKLKELFDSALAKSMNNK